MSPLTPPPEITGSAVLVSVLPLAGLVMVGAAGAVVGDRVRTTPVPPSEATCSAPAPSVEALKSSVAVCEPLVIWATPVEEL